MFTSAKSAELQIFRCNEYIPKNPPMSNSLDLFELIFYNARDLNWLI